MLITLRYYDGIEDFVEEIERVPPPAHNDGSVPLVMLLLQVVSGVDALPAAVVLVPAARVISSGLYRTSGKQLSRSRYLWKFDNLIC